MVMTNDPPVCHNGYQSTDTRPPQDGSNRPMNVHASCTEPASRSNPRGAQHAPSNRPAAGYRTPVASYDPTTGRLTWLTSSHHLNPTLTDPGSPAPATLGEESWKWLLLQPLTQPSR
jgi:phospholipid/cholesterol/gamma-HCH transport system substrate-binding protein